MTDHNNSQNYNPYTYMLHISFVTFFWLVFNCSFRCEFCKMRFQMTNMWFIKKAKRCHVLWQLCSSYDEESLELDLGDLCFRPCMASLFLPWLRRKSYDTAKTTQLKSKLKNWCRYLAIKLCVWASYQILMIIFECFNFHISKSKYQTVINT